MDMTPEQIIREHLAAAGRKGAAARMERTTPEQRTASAKKAAVKRWRAYRKKNREKSS